MEVVVVFPPLGMHYRVGSFHGFLSELRTGQFICLNIKKIMPRWLDFQKAPLGLRHGSNRAMSARQKPAYFPASLSTQLPAANLWDC